MRRMVMVLAAVAALMMAAACTPEEPAAARDPESATVDDFAGDAPMGDEPARFTSLTVTRSGGFAGITETLEVAEDGAWTFVKARMAPEEGVLGEHELSRLRALVAALHHTDLSGLDDGGCADAFTYAVATVPADGDPLEVAMSECATEPVAEMTGLIDFLVDETPL